MISEKVRAAESDIDEQIRHLPIWKCQRNLILRDLIDFWRDGIELALIQFAHSAILHSADSFAEATATEHRVNTGVFWCLKWAFEYASNSATEGPRPDQIADAVIEVGAPHQLLVDSLKFATVEGIEFEVDVERRTLIIYEGGQREWIRSRDRVTRSHVAPLPQANPTR